MYNMLSDGKMETKTTVNISFTFPYSNYLVLIIILPFTQMSYNFIKQIIADM